MNQRPTRWQRWSFRSPLWLYRSGFGGAERYLGFHWILVRTTGRRTGKPHAVLLDIIHYDRETDVYTVQPAYGRNADWVRNADVNPAVLAEVGQRRFRATVEPVAPDRGAEIMLRFIQARPLYWRYICWVMGIEPPEDAKSEEGLRRWIAREFMFLAIRADKSPFSPGAIPLRPGDSG